MDNHCSSFTGPCFSGVWTRWPFWADGQSWRVDETAQCHHQLRLLTSDPPPTFSCGPLWNSPFPSLHVTCCPLVEANVAPLCVWRHLCEAVRLLLVLCCVCSILGHVQGDGNRTAETWQQHSTNSTNSALVKVFKRKTLLSLQPQTQN